MDDRIKRPVRNPDFNGDRFVIGISLQRTLRFLLGIGLFINEALKPMPSWELLMVFGTIMGSPLANYGDDLRRAVTGRRSDPLTKPAPEETL